ncbi:c-type cytochrome [Sandaracinobacteroides hominis]|uniref:c-type cytochrome n=1 Tax=Sandaracinobacteroides hominis TaxID=2780086 RepID=UPI0018F4AC11|nr:cytochrome c family protein [Sandaracinobacteroides hominis]
MQRNGLKLLVLAAAALSGAAHAQAVPAGDPAVGQKLFIQCKACHTTEPGGKNLVGPNLSGIMGSKTGEVPGFVFSPAMQKANITWDATTMDAWLKRPSAVIPGTKMVFAGMPDPKKRADVIAYLNTLKKKR